MRKHPTASIFFDREDPQMSKLLDDESLNREENPSLVESMDERAIKNKSKFHIKPALSQQRERAKYSRTHVHNGLCYSSNEINDSQPRYHRLEWNVTALPPDMAHPINPARFNYNSLYSQIENDHKLLERLR
eukprot:CAMPEP_0168612136 /NCGR_PEP_ID=MMETSP0449_2-20121227/2746_1 /TAXON_ID=1082188 /ORGANISM="Strombidium rassoulzadegani, Strain ras09" /LENGTH=131 /DNA_ID=CAMNT_0008652661 /DNA_START=26 /DNA_END=421 /DNA_ORIENTATION=-